MPDISMCKNETCPLKETCYRFMASPSKYGQSYSNFTPKTSLDGKTKCEYHWEIQSLNKNEKTN